MDRLSSVLLFIVITTVLFYGGYNTIHPRSAILNKKVIKRADDKEIYYNNENDTVAYITDVINNGSNKFNLKGGAMKGGYIPKEMAKYVACYVYELSCKVSSYKFNKSVSLYFSSSCAGCNGYDGKGIKGTYPDLTKRKLLGIKESLWF